MVTPFPGSQGVFSDLLLAEMILWDACREKLACLVLGFAVPSPSLVLGTGGDKTAETLTGFEGVGVLGACPSDLLIRLVFSLLHFLLRSHLVPDSIKPRVNLMYSSKSKV